MIANTIQSIVTQASLLTEQVRKKSDQLQGILIFSLSIYFVIYVLGTSMVGGSQNVQVFISTFSAANSVFTLLGMSIYWHTIQMLRMSINECVTFKFDTQGVYCIYGLYCFIFAVQMAYLFSYQLMKNAIIVSTLIHLSSYFLITLIVFVMLLRTGNGLKMVTHRLQDGSIQYEGYDKNEKHLFTFTSYLDEGGQYRTKTGGRGGADTDSSDEESVSNLERTMTSFGGDVFLEGYEANE